MCRVWVLQVFQQRFGHAACDQQRCRVRPAGAGLPPCVCGRAVTAHVKAGRQCLGAARFHGMAARRTRGERRRGEGGGACGADETGDDGEARGVGLDPLHQHLTARARGQPGPWVQMLGEKRATAGAGRCSSPRQRPAPRKHHAPSPVPTPAVPARHPRRHAFGACRGAMLRRAAGCALLLVMMTLQSAAAAGASDGAEAHLLHRHGSRGAQSAGTPTADDQKLMRPMRVLAQAQRIMFTHPRRAATALSRVARESVRLIVAAIRKRLSAFRMPAWQQELLSSTRQPELVWKAASVGGVERSNVSDSDVERGLGQGRDLPSEEVCVRAVVSIPVKRDAMSSHRDRVFSVRGRRTRRNLVQRHARASQHEHAWTHLRNSGVCARARTCGADHFGLHV